MHLESTPGDFMQRHWQRRWLQVFCTLTSVLLLTNISLAGDCTLGGANRALQFPEGKTSFDYEVVNPYLRDCVIDQFGSQYANHLKDTPVKKKMRTDVDNGNFKKVVAGLKQGQFTTDAGRNPNGDKVLLENLMRFARGAKARCSRDSNYKASTEGFGAGSAMPGATEFIGYCYEVSKLAKFVLSETSTEGSYTIKIADDDITAHRTRCETEARTALSCQIACKSTINSDRANQCSKFDTKYTRDSSPRQNEIGKLAVSCVEQLDLNPNHESCQKLCDMEPESCAEGLNPKVAGAAPGSPGGSLAPGEPDITVEEPGGGSPTGAGVDGTLGEIPDVVDEKASPNDADPFETAADRAGQQVFGGAGMPGANTNQPLSFNADAPDVTSNQSLSPSQFRGNQGGGDSTRIQPSSGGSPRSVISQIAPPNLAIPTGGESKSNQGPGGAFNPRGGGGGSGGGISAGGGNGGGRARRRGRRASRKTKASALGGNRYFGATGASSGGGAATTTLSPALKKKIAANKLKQINPNRAANEAFRRGLTQANLDDSGNLLPGMYFPEADLAHDCIRSNESLPDQRGQMKRFNDPFVCQGK